MAKIRISKEELEHDEVLESADVFLHWLRDNLKTILMVIATVLAAYLVIGMMHASRQGKLVEANDMLAEAMDKYESAMAEYEWATPQRQDAMQEVVNLTQQIVEDYSGTAIARQALLLQGNAYYNAGDDLAESLEAGAPNTNNAINAFTRFVAEADTPFEQAKGNLALGYAYENAFFLTNQESYLSDAINTFQDVINDTEAPEFLRGEALLGVARNLAFQGNTAQAEEMYRNLLRARYEPLEPLPANASPAERLIHDIKERSTVVSLAGSARLELQRLGVDVSEEFPIVAPAEEEAETGEGGEG